MKKIQSVVCDLDGSLLNHFKDVSPANQALLVQLANSGCLVGIASGRPASEIVDNLGRWGLNDAVSFIIASNGCTTLNRILQKRNDSGLLDLQALFKVERALKKYPVCVGVLHQGKLYFNRSDFSSLIYALVSKKIPVFGDFSTLKDAQFAKVYITGAAAVLKKIAEDVKIEGLQLVPVGRHSLEAVRNGVSKFGSLEEIISDFKIPAENVLSFGDDFNDIELLSNTHGVAMKNSPREVLDAAGTVTKYAASQDGIAYHLNEMLLSKEYEFTGIDREALQ